MGKAKGLKNEGLDENDITAARMGLEKKMNEMGRLLESKNFSSAKEANAYLDKIMNSDEPLPERELTPIEKAQDIMYDAWDSAGKQRVKLARQALEISKDCADAYALLAEEAQETGNLKEAKTLYLQGVEAGERAIGKSAFIHDAGHFWGITETRPYMRARMGLAQVSEALGFFDEARMHYADMLRLNPNDNQGVRYLFANCLLALSRDDELGKLLKKYGDEASADWDYTRALWAYRTKNPKAHEYLKKALKSNPHVPGYLLGLRKMPSRLPEYVGVGDKDEAISYAANALDAWRNTTGALEWLTKEAGVPGKFQRNEANP